MRPLETSEEQVLLSVPESLQPVVLGLRGLVLSVHPSATIVAWPRQGIISFGLGPRKMTEHYVYIAAHGRHVNLGLYHGATMRSSGIVLEGTGKKLRHLKIHTVDDIKGARLRALVRAAYRERNGALAAAALGGAAK